MTNIEQLKYPVGKFIRKENYPIDEIMEMIKYIESFHGRIKSEVENLSDEQLDTPYRPDGWTVRQVVHHCADSHMNAFIRFKLAMTEDAPTIKPYIEDRWAKMPDTISTPIDASLMIIDGLHKRWSILLKAMSADDFERTYLHPQYERVFVLKEVLALYTWHCTHHLAHITSLKKRMNWI